MGKIIAVANQKGGVAKTTSTYNIAAQKASEGKTVLMIDLDPQSSLTIAAGINPGAEDLEGVSTCLLFDKTVDPRKCCVAVETAGVENLYIVPSDIDLAVTEKDLAVSRNSDVQLRKATQKLRGYFDYIIIDCPPQLGTLLTNALTAADEVVVPVKTDYLAYRGLRALMDTIEDVRTGDEDRSLNPDLKYLGVIATLFKQNSNDNKDILKLLERDHNVLGVIKDMVAVNRGIMDGRPVVLTDPASEAAQSYKKVADKL